MKCHLFCAILLYLSLGAGAQEKSVALYSGKPPGSENWNWQEGRSDSNMFHTPVVYNVVQPTLAVFEPDPAHAVGTAVIIAPGGGFQILSINSEGYDVAKWLAARGVTAFVLKYRLNHTVGSDPVKELVGYMSRNVLDSAIRPIVPLAIADGMAAVEYVRKHAADYRIRPDRVGLMGFSAGGTVTMGVVYDAKAESLPDFIAPVYAYLAPGLAGKVPEKKTPAFIVVATDDQLAPHSVRIYNQWLEAKQSAELHIYAKGGHGFGMRKQHIPTDGWIERFGDWLEVQGLLNHAK